MKLFQIYEADLVELEHTLPELLGSMDTLTNRQRVQWRRVREIVTNIRWNYGPHLESEQVHDDQSPPDLQS